MRREQWRWPAIESRRVRLESRRLPLPTRSSMRPLRSVPFRSVSFRSDAPRFNKQRASNSDRRAAPRELFAPSRHSTRHQRRARRQQPSEYSRAPRPPASRLLFDHRAIRADQLRSIHCGAQHSNTVFNVLTTRHGGHTAISPCSALTRLERSKNSSIARTKLVEYRSL